MENLSETKAIIRKRKQFKLGRKKYGKYKKVSRRIMRRKKVQGFLNNNPTAVFNAIFRNSFINPQTPNPDIHIIFYFENLHY